MSATLDGPHTPNQIQKLGCKRKKSGGRGKMVFGSLESLVVEGRGGGGAEQAGGGAHPVNTRIPLPRFLFQAERERERKRGQGEIP